MFDAAEVVILLVCNQSVLDPTNYFGFPGLYID